VNPKTSVSRYRLNISEPVAKAEPMVAARPSGERWTVANDEREVCTFVDRFRIPDRWACARLLRGAGFYAGSPRLKLLREPDEQPFGPANVAQPIRLLVLHHVADELRAMLLEPGERLVDIVNGEHDA